jgi:hypothetical protein
MSNIVERAGHVVVRIGGNTQETAMLVQSTPDGRILEKDQQGTFNPARTFLYFHPKCADRVVDEYASHCIYPGPSTNDEERLLNDQRPLVPR